MFKSFSLYLNLESIKKNINIKNRYRFYQFKDISIGFLDIDSCNNKTCIELFEKENQIRQYYVSQRIFNNIIEYSFKANSNIKLIDIEFFKQKSISKVDYEEVKDAIYEYRFFMEAIYELQDNYDVDIKNIKILYRNREITICESGRILIEEPENILDAIIGDKIISGLLAGYSI